MDPFIYTTNTSRVVFGNGTVSQLPHELTLKGLQAVLILSTPEQIDQGNRIKDLVGSKAVGVFAKATMHTPVIITDEAIRITEDLKADGLVSVGGGSTIGLGKAISFRTGLPHIAIPTSYAGSEMTPILGETDRGHKVTKRDSRIIPQVVIYDVNLTLTMPYSLVATSGVNALAHAIESLYAADTNPIVRLLAKEGIKALSTAMVAISKATHDPESRSQALYGAWLCGICLGSTSMSFHHKLAHSLGGSFGLPHAQTHTILLPHTVAYNSRPAPDAMKDLAEALATSGEDVIAALNNLLEQLGVERSLKAIGLQEVDIDKAAVVAMRNSYGNPREVKEDDVREILRRAWAGEPARADL